MKRKLQIFWWKLTLAKRFRVHLNDENVEGYTDLMTYLNAKQFQFFYGGQLVCDHNKILKR